MANFVDSVAMVLPWAGGLVPATLTYQNLQTAGLELWQAAVVAGVVEGMGFVAVTTVIDIYEHNRAEQASAKVNTWNAGSGSVFDGAFWIAIGGTALYLVAVLLINMALDPAANAAKVATGGLLSTFGVLGGVMVALRNQLGKRRAAAELAEIRERQAEADAREQARMERERVQAVQAEKDRLAVEFERALQADQLRMAHELQMENQQAENARKLEKVRAVQAHSAPTMPAVEAQSEQVRRMVQCREPGCGMEYAAIGGKGGHYKKWHSQPPSGSPQTQEQRLGGEKDGGVA